MRLHLKTIAAAAAVLTAFGAWTLQTAAEEPYEVYNYNARGEAVPSQAGYLAERTISGADLGISALNAPRDLCKDAADCFYLADTGNHRIIKTDSEFSSVLRIYDSFLLPDGTQTALNSPGGIYAAEDGTLYIADTGNSRALIADAEGNIQLVIEKPDSPLYDQQLAFQPQKILCDTAGNIYVILNNTTKGAAMFDASGVFLGYYGANSVTPTAQVIADAFWNMIASEQERRSSIRHTPTAFDNFDIDGMFIFTTTSAAGAQRDIVKKVNPEGYNLFGDLEAQRWGDRSAAWYGGTFYQSRIVDVDIGDDGSINCLDAATGRVFQYDEEANLLFIMGTTGDQVGAFASGGSAAALETKGAGCEEIYVLDSDRGTVTVFRQTPFGATVHAATALYNSGYYKEALAPWQEVLRQDGSYRRAYLGAASAYYSMGQYQDAMAYAKKADAAGIYNKAFARYRSEFLRAHLTEILLGIAVLTAGGLTYRRYRKQSGKQNLTKDKT